MWSGTSRAMAKVLIVLATPVFVTMAAWSSWQRRGFCEWRAGMEIQDAVAFYTRQRLFGLLIVFVCRRRRAAESSSSRRHGSPAWRSLGFCWATYVTRGAVHPLGFALAYECASGRLGLIGQVRCRTTSRRCGGRELLFRPVPRGLGFIVTATEVFGSSGCGCRRWVTKSGWAPGSSASWRRSGPRMAATPFMPHRGHPGCLRLIGVTDAGAP
jgi:hypothetical protein